MSDRFEAIILDMDGVVTDTARVHLGAWRRLFDDYLAGRAAGGGPFTDEDYRAHVDGRVRLDGVTTFLASRGIELPAGSPTDPPNVETAWGLANRKNELFVAAVENDGVDTFPSTLALVRRLRVAGVRTALVTASRNAELVLAKAGANDLFDAMVDGADAAELGLPGKPDPATFLEASHRLGSSPGVCVVVEDATSGVEAGRRGRFGLVIGVDRTGHPDALREAGADLVVNDLGELPDERFYADDPWVLAYRGFDPASEGTREALLTLGNGYLATRGTMAHVAADSVHYPATYVAGTYNRLVSRIDDHTREDESIVNLPNWLPVTFRCDGGEWLTPGRWTLADHRVALDVRTATTTRELTAIDPGGRRTRIVERRLVSMASPHVAAMQTRLTPENWSGQLELRSLVDGRVANSNVAAHRQLANQHLDVVDRRIDHDTACLVARTSASHIRIAVAVRNRVQHDGATVELAPHLDDDVAGHELCVEVVSGQELVLEKAAGIATSRDHAIAEPSLAAVRAASTAPPFADLLDEHTRRWDHLWRRFHIDISDGDRDQFAVRFHILHVLQTLSPNTTGLDVGVPARGLHGEGYRGHVFWDELFVFPFIDLRLPELTRGLLLYRWRRLDEARRRAAALGCRGALFPWQSGSDGRDETPRELFNPRSGRWMPDNSQRQYHVNLAVAYNAWQHWQVTADLGFLLRHGAELLVESARFFASLATYDEADDRFDIRGVMGPDEFHDGYPGRPGEGIDNNAYVNVMAAWALTRARDVYDLLGALGVELWRRLGVDADELARWNHMSRRLRVPFLRNGLLAQFEGYDDLEELDWDRLRQTYDKIGRLDLILEAEGDSPNRYKLSKQADVLMLFYLLTAEELGQVIERLGYDFDPETIPEAVDYYGARTSHGSTLSRVAHAWVLARSDRSRAWQLFRESLGADLDDEQGGTTREGIHLGAMAGTIDILQRCFTGLDARGDVLRFNPLLPDELQAIDTVIRYRGQLLDVHVDHHELRLTAAHGPAAPVMIALRDDEHILAAGGSLELALRPPTPGDGRRVRSTR